jgi:hypothetical protein
VFLGPFSASAILSERIASAVRLSDDRTARHQPKPRAQLGACEGPKRTTSGSEPDTLPIIASWVLNKNAPFYDPREAGASAGQPDGDWKKLLSCPDNK